LRDFFPRTLPWAHCGRFLLVSLVVAGLGAAQPAAAEDNPIELYNAACRASLDGNRPAALSAFRAALAAGFDDLRYARQDPDLAALREDPGFQALLDDRNRDLAALSETHGFGLESGTWSEPRPLTGPGGTPTVRLKWVPTGLEIEAVAPGSWPGFGGKEAEAPWAGGSALLVTLAVPDGTSGFESANLYMFAFGNEMGTHLGAVYQEELQRWQPLRELDTRIVNGQDGADHRITVTVPWQSVLPYHPLTDPTLGLNIYLRLGPRGQAVRAQLFPDPRVADATFPVKRFVPVAFNRESEPRESFLGRLDDTLAGPGPLDIHLTALSLDAGPGLLTLDFLDNKNQSVLPAGALTWDVDLTAGLNTFTRSADFTNLHQGPYLMRGRLDLPSGRSATFSRTVLRLNDPWTGGLDARLEVLAEGDRRTVDRQIRTIQAALDTHRPRRNPSPVIKALTDLETMLVTADRTGSVLPPSGPFLFIYPGPDGTDRACSLYLPEGYLDATVLNPVLVMTDFPRGNEPLINRLMRSYEYNRDRDTSQAPSAGDVPIFLVPHLPTAGGDIRAAAEAEISAAVAWAAERFGPNGVSLVGVDYAGGPALEAALAAPGRIRHLVIFAGRDLEPYPGANRDFLRGKLDPAPGALPVTWFDFKQESQLSAQPAMLFSIMGELGYNVVEAQTVRGGLNLTQIADRLYLWAEAQR